MTDEQQADARRLQSRYSRLFALKLTEVQIVETEHDVLIFSTSKPRLPRWSLADLRDIRAQAGLGVR